VDATGREQRGAGPGLTVSTNLRRARRGLGGLGGVVGLVALTRPLGSVDGTAVGLASVRTLDPAVAAAALSIGALTLAGGVIAPVNPARGEQLLGTAAGLLLLALAGSRLVGAAVTPGPGTYLVVLSFGLAEVGDLLDPAYTNPRASTTVAVVAMGAFVLASWRFLLAGDAVGWGAGAVAVVAWLVALGWELTGSRE
jgi:hypothetical protein